MPVKKLIALAGATTAMIAAPTTAALAAGTTVSVRVEGVAKTLLPSTSVTTHRGWITKDRTPRGKCPATSAAGALDVATNHNWGGRYTKSFGLELTSILGETHLFSTRRYFWEIFVNDVAASVGACGQKLHRSDHLLFAAVTQRGFEYPIAIRAPRHAHVGHFFTAHVVYFNASGVAKPLAHALLTIHDKSVRTKSRGTVRVKWGSAGTIILNASRKGYIRAAPVRVQVSA